jgi:cytochrome c-type biogenesis protein CcmH/NrfG
MTETRESLEARKRDLFAAIRTLDADYEDGSLDESVYLSTRDRYEREAADILERLDALDDAPAVSAPPPRRRPRSLGTAVTLLVIAGLIVVVLVGALQRRSENTALSQAAPQPTAPTSPALVKARRAVLKNPQDATAQIALGNAYLNLGEAAQADVRYREAMQLEPSNALAPTMHAMVLGSRSHRVQALALLRSVELSHPRFARAWLLDGVISSHARSTYTRAIRAWKRFLALEPKSPVAATIRRSITAVEKAEASRR